MAGAKKSKLMISPIDIDTSPIVRYSSMLPNYSIEGVVAPTGWGYENKDVSYIDGGQKTGIVVGANFEELLAGCDSVLFNFSKRGTDLLSYLSPQIEQAARAGKEILISDSCNGENHKIIRNIEDIYDVKSLGNKEMDESNVQKQLYSINTPIVFVAGLGERCNKFETQLSIRQYFEQTGFNVCQIGSKDYSGLFGFKAIPDYIFNDRGSMEDKIYLFNHYVKDLEKRVKPDLFIVGIPGGIMSFNHKATNHFSEMAYILANAIRPDAVVLNLYFDFFKDEYFKEIQNYCKYKYDFNVVCHVVANTKYDLDFEDAENYLSYLSLDSRFVMKGISDLLKKKWNIFNVLEDKEKLSMPECIYNVLAGNTNRLINN